MRWPIRQQYRLTPQAQLFCVVSRQHSLNNMAMDIRQPEITALETIRQTLVIDAHQMQNRRMEIVNMDDIFGHVNPVWIGFSIGDARFDTTASEPG